MGIILLYSPWHTQNSILGMIRLCYIISSPGREIAQSASVALVPLRVLRCS